MRVVTTIIDLEKPTTWPAILTDYLEVHRSLFLDWESGSYTVKASDYDRAVYKLQDILQQFELVGWHCTRLTETEMVVIKADGMQLPDVAMLHRKLDALVDSGVISTVLASSFRATNQAHEKSRAGMVWFCFYPPRLAGESGINRFFRNWGGEALYNSHEDDPETCTVLRGIGTPCLVEAVVPISSLEPHGGLYAKVVRRFLNSRGSQTTEPVDHEDRIKRPLPATNIRRIITFPADEFLALTRCDEWRNPLTRSLVVPD
jgi:hypothetical protein